VQINGVPAPMIYASAQQVAVVAPYGVAPYGAVATGPPLLNGSDRHLPGLRLGYGEDRRRRNGSLDYLRGMPAGRDKAAAVNQDGIVNSAVHPAAPGSVIFPLCDRRGRHNAGWNRWQARLRAPAVPIEAAHRDDRRPDGHPTTPAAHLAKSPA